MSEEEEKATVVIDFNEVKDQLDDVDLNDGEEINIEEEIQFGGGDLDMDSDLGEDDESEELDLDSLLANPEPIQEVEESNKTKIYFFDYQSEFFQNKFNEPDSHMTILETLAALNEALQMDEPCIIVFYYTSNPKVVNQLTGQIKNLFPLAKTLIIAKNLSATKAQQHHDSKYGANSYLSEPFELEEFNKTIEKI